MGKWQFFQITQLVMFIYVSLFLFCREIDGSGAENTLQVKLMSFAVWLAFYIGLLIVEYGIYFINKLIRKNRNN